jgi:anti-sigma regulatory factor (Ser/Thr protein kinase)
VIDARTIRRAAFTLTSGNVREAVAWIATQMTEIGATERQSFRAQLAAEELLLNAIEHGGRDPLSASVTLESLPEGLRLTLQDDGAPFNFFDAPERKIDQTIETARPGGWGLELVRRFAQVISCRRVDSRNVVVLDFPL